MTDVEPIIDLNFTGVDAIQGGFTPVPPGVYRLLIHDPTLEPAKEGGKYKYGGRVIKFTTVAVEPEEYAGRQIRQDTWFVPNPPPQNASNEDRQKFDTSMGFLLGKLSAVYGSIPENFRLNVRDLGGRDFLAVVVVRLSSQFGEQNEITTYLPPDTDVSKVSVPKEPLGERRTAVATSTTEAAPAALGRFKI